MYIPILYNDIYAYINACILICVSVCLHVCVNTVCLSGSYAGQKIALNFLELESKAVVSYHVSAGNKFWVLCKKRQELLAIDR